MGLYSGISAFEDYRIELDRRLRYKFSLFENTDRQLEKFRSNIWVDVMGCAIKGSEIFIDKDESCAVFSVLCTPGHWLASNVRVGGHLPRMISPYVSFVQRVPEVPNFLIQYRWQLSGAEHTSGWSNSACKDLLSADAGAVLNRRVIDENGIITPDAYSSKDFVQLRLIRDFNNASGLFGGIDTYNLEVEVLGFGLLLDL